MAKVCGVSLLAFFYLLITRCASAAATAASTSICPGVEASVEDGATCQQAMQTKSASLTQLSSGVTKDLRPSLAQGIIMAGDIIYLRAHTGNFLDAENGVVACRFNDTGTRQMFRIEKDGGGAIHNSDTVSLRTHEDKHVGVQNEDVSADWDTYESEGIDLLSISSSLAEQHAQPGWWGEMDPGAQPGWGDVDPGAGKTPGNGMLPPLPGGIQAAFHIETEADGTDVIRKDDQNFLRAYTTMHIGVEGTAVQARRDEFDSQRRFIIERIDPPIPPPPSSNTDPHGPDAIVAGETIYIRAHTGKFLEVWKGVGPSIRCDWDKKKGEFQEFRLDKTGGGVIRTGDTVYLKSKYNYHVTVDGEYIRETGEGNWRDDMKFIIEKDDAGMGVTNVNDAIYLRAHTGMQVEVHQPFLPKFECNLCAAVVKVNKPLKGAYMKFTIERGAK